MSSVSPPKEHYRPNVAMLLVDEDGKILICERINETGAWQFPQGGVDKGEDHLTAFYREMNEEIGLKAKDFKLLEIRPGYSYKYPPGVREKKKAKHNCVGQEQMYFLCKLKSPKDCVDINQKSPEFQDLQWIKPEKFELKWLPGFKQETYKQVFLDFFGCELS